MRKNSPPPASLSFFMLYRPAVPNLFGTRDWFHRRQFFHGLGWGDSFGMIQVPYIYCAFYFYYYYVVIYNEIITQLTIMLTGGGAQAVMWAMGSGCKYRSDEASLIHPPLTSCHAAWFLTGHGPVPVRGLGTLGMDYSIWVAIITGPNILAIWKVA